MNSILSRIAGTLCALLLAVPALAATVTLNQTARLNGFSFASIINTPITFYCCWQPKRWAVWTAPMSARLWAFGMD